VNNLQRIARHRLQSIQTRAELLATRLARNVATASGVEMSFGEYEYEKNAALVGDEKWNTLAKMQNDPRIAGALRLSRLPLQRATWEYRPASDDPRDMEIAAFCNANLLRKPSREFGFGREFFIQTPWITRLGEILDFLPSGRAVFLSTFKAAPNLKQVYDRLQWLEPASISGTRPWDLDGTDQIKGINRQFSKPDDDAQETDLFHEAHRLKVYGWDVIGARYDGRPYTRPMFGSWFRKDFMARMAAIWVQKVGAPPPMGSFPDDWDNETKLKFQDYVKSLRGSAPAHAFGVFPLSKRDGKAAEVSYTGSETGEVDRMRAPMDFENAEIAAAAGSKSLLLGETASGSRSLGDSQGLIELVFVEAVATFVIEQEMHGFANIRGVTEELVERNYSGVVIMPTLHVSDINPFFL